VELNRSAEYGDKRMVEVYGCRSLRRENEGCSVEAKRNRSTTLLRPEVGLTPVWLTKTTAS
jgi:hypothetical protein